jgi:sigma-B regulation protein RsbU (phosphoserine phosphatase)
MSTQPTNPALILVVEDSRIQSKILANKLQQAGYEVETAENGRIGLESIRKRRPTLVISDIEMPEMTGYELCRQVKNDPDLRSIPFILLSTLSDAQDIIKGLHCGADNYVTKPYDPAFLISRVASLLETPLDDGEDEQQLSVTLGGTQYSVRAGRQQVLNLLVSTFENAVEKNQELARTNEELTVAKEQLTQWNDQLESLNTQLEQANDRMTRDLDAAAKVQQSLLPSAGREFPGFDFAWEYLPCDELAGDFLNFFQLDEDHVALYVVDVSGHGVASSLLSVTIGRLMTPLVSSSSLLVQDDGQGGRKIIAPAQVAYELNRRFQMEEQNELFFTMLYGVLQRSTLEFRFVSAGNDPIVHVSDDRLPRMVEVNNMAIGWVEEMEYEEGKIDLKPGDRLYVYSDGVPEAMDADLNEFTMRQMMEIIELGQHQSVAESVRLLCESVERWSAKNGPKDDVSILGVEVRN